MLKSKKKNWGAICMVRIMNLSDKSFFLKITLKSHIFLAYF